MGRNSSPKAEYGFVLVTAIEFILKNYKPFYVIFVVLNVRKKFTVVST